MLVPILAILALAAAAPSNTCPTYTCSETISPNCMEGDQVAMKVNPCAAGEICPFIFTGNSTCESVPELEVYPGDYCAFNAYCTSGVCESGLCVNLMDPNCTNVYDCSPGLYCNMSALHCEPQRGLGESCTYEYDCMNDMTCIQGVCVEYLSLGLNEQVDFVEDLNTGLTLACMTGFSEYSDQLGTNICATAPKSSAVPTQCQPGTLCQDSTEVYKAPCICGYGSSGYCPLFPGDPLVQQFLNNLRLIITLNAACNTFSRFRFTCFGQSNPDVRNLFNEFQVQYTQLVNGLYPLAVNAQSCVANTLLSDLVAMQTAAATEVTAECPAYDCAYEQEMEEDQQCAYYEVNIDGYLYSTPIIHLAPCSNSTTVCNIIPGGNTTCEAPVPTRYPGDYCETHMDCVLSDCGSNMCQGKLLNSTCMNIYDCNPGAYCDPETLMCTLLKTQGANCTSEYECENHLGCNLGVCTLYFSVPNGNMTDSVSGDGLATMCASGFAYMNECQAPPKSVNPPPYNCTIGTACSSTISEIWKPCTCGYNSNGKSYCPLFLGDPVPQLAITYMKQLTAFNHICNTFSRFEEGCFLRTTASLKSYYSYASAMVNFTTYAQIQEVEECMFTTVAKSVVETYEKAVYYNQPQPQPDKDENGSSGEVLAASLLLLFTL